MTNSEPTIDLPVGISQREIAERIGISVSTVSRVLSGYQRVSARTRADVQRAIDELLDEREQPQKTTTRMIGLTPSNLTGESYGRTTRSSLQESLEGAEPSAGRLGFMLYTWANSSLLLENAGETFFSAVEGVIMVGGVVDIEILDAIQAHNLPVVLTGGAIPNRSIPSVGADAMYGAMVAIQHLLELGHRRIAIVNGPPSTYTTTEKRAGYLAALAAAGITFAPQYLAGGYAGMEFNEQRGFQETEKLLRLDEPPTAIFYAADSLAHGGRAACTARGLRVPDDVSIIGYDDSPSALTSVPSLSSVHIDRRAWGAAAVQRLVSFIERGDDSMGRLLLPACLHVRESVGPPPRSR